MFHHSVRRTVTLFAASLSLLSAGVAFGATTPAPDSIQVGQMAPDFQLPNQSGIETSLHQFRGHWVVLYFYPKDFTKGCTLEAHNFQHDSSLYAQAGAVIVGVSVDPVGSHQGFCSQEKLGFKLLSDTAATVVTRYGCLMQWKGHTLAARTTFLIDPAGKVAKIYRGVKPAGHSAEVLADLAELRKSSQYNE